VATVEDAAPGPVGYDRRLEQLGQLADLGTGVQRAAADEDQRTLGPPEHFGRPLDRVGVDDRGVRPERRPDLADLGALGQDVHRDFEGDRARSVGARGLDRLGQLRRRLGRRADAVGPLGELPKQAELVR
jgi:hypothetical protein